MVSKTEIAHDWLHSATVNIARGPCLHVGGGQRMTLLKTACVDTKHDTLLNNAEVNVIVYSPCAEDRKLSSRRVEK